MAIRITNFAGERPRVSSRDLGLEGSQINSNLLATSIEFRPVKGPVRVADATDFVNPVPVAKTLYRRLHNAAGGVRTGDSDGWYANSTELSIVKGQLVDDTKERTYISFANGSMPPRESDMTNEAYPFPSYPLGVPAPTQPQVKLNAATYFTMDQATAWRDNIYLPAILKAVQDNLVESRYTAIGPNSGTTTAGVTATHFRAPYQFPTSNQRGISEPANILLAVPLSTVDITCLGDQRLSGIKDSTYNWLAFPACPTWGMVSNTAAVKAALLAIKNPRKSDGSALWTDAYATGVTAGLVAMFSPADTEVAALRASLDQAFEDFTAAIYYATVSAVGAPSPAPAEPMLTDAKYSGWIYTVASTSGGDSQISTPEVKNAQYVQYENDHIIWAASNDKYTSYVNGLKVDNFKRVADAVNAQTVAAQIVAQIEALYVSRKTNLLDTLKSNTDQLGLAKSEFSPNGIVAVDADRMVDYRFYAATFVTKWNEESAPSPVSVAVECAQHDSVTLFTPTPPAEYTNIDRVRWYRSNVGTTNTAFQLVKEVLLTQTVRAPIVNLLGVSGHAVGPGGVVDSTEDWTDALASWCVKFGLSPSPMPDFPVAGGDHLQPGDTIGLRNPTTNVVTVKTWTGSQWVDNGPAPSSDSISAKAFVDGIASKALETDVLPTVGWAMPPSVTTGAVTTHLQGLKGGANGVMAGFIGNFVAFSVPYTHYAWPVKYQVPLEFPVVGLCAFGQSWFVGTAGNPYIIYGDQPENYVAQKLDSSQSCVSAKSIVASGGGVFYASPDGYCFAGLNGVQVITQALIANEDWRSLDPSSIFAVIYDNVLYFWYTGNGGGCYGYDMSANKLTRHDIPATAVFDDVVTDAVYAAYDGGVYKLFYGDRKTGLYRSGSILPGNYPALAWLQVWGDQSVATPAIIRLYSDTALLWTSTVTSTNPVRIPPGRYAEYTVEVESKARITHVTLAGNTAELQSV